MSHFVRTFKRRKAFLDSLSEGDSPSLAAKIAGGTLQNFKSWRKDDPNFAKDWEEAEDEGTDYLEDVATQRAIKKSDPLMMMMLKARRPDKYDRGSKLELSGGISVEGSKQKLLNRLARLQAEGALSAPPPVPESEVSPAQLPEEKQKLLASPTDPGDLRGRKRRAAAEGGRRKTAA